MNERIKEFRFKAAEYANEQKPLGITKWNEMRDEKFAELIVEQCVAQCWTVSEMEHKGDVISECSKRMRKHFGVEE